MAEPTRPAASPPGAAKENKATPGEWNREQASDEYGAHSEHQEDVAGEERAAGVPRETREDQRKTQSGGRTGNA
ncbi:hypothetical protein [Ideonella sp. BN130291]|uniref:hypothetical protein n=1 Tax=Ideonella sp. BN130291 TaxID=3112940 RepID=UPI002E25E3AC|nr:hypothetical protein [Ideonella sp. BN130291]